MAKSKRLSSKQFALIEDLLRGELDEPEILDKHKLARRLYRRWLADEAFCEELNQRVAGEYRQSKFLVARYAPSAAARLVKLTECGKEETARKACLDIITMNPSTSSTCPPVAPDDKTKELAPISPQAASRLLAVLAEEDSKDS